MRSLRHRKAWAVSEDNGKTWSLIPAEDIPKYKPEHGIPSYISRSTDGGCTWSKPEKFDDCGVYPQTLTLGCGVTLAAYGRPCLYVRATDDPSGTIREVPIRLMYGTLDTPVAASCYYTTWLAQDERTALLTYADFHIKDENGVDRKCIMVRTVKVEE